MTFMCCQVVPGGLDAFFEEIGKPVEKGVFFPPPSLSKEELGKLKSIAEKYGEQLYPPDYLDPVPSDL